MPRPPAPTGSTRNGARCPRTALKTDRLTVPKLRGEGRGKDAAGGESGEEEPSRGRGARKQEGSCATPVREAVARGARSGVAGARTAGSGGQVRMWRDDDQRRGWEVGAKERGEGGGGRKVWEEGHSGFEGGCSRAPREEPGERWSAGRGCGELGGRGGGVFWEGSR